MRKILATLLLACASALALAPLAHTDDGDSAFIDTLNAVGLATQYTSASKINVAHQICSLYDEGFGDSDVFATVARDEGMSLPQAGFFVGASVAAYCPEYEGFQPGSRTRKL
jgi:hypothetical protein